MTGESRGTPEACGVCGRTILAGERLREYVSRDAERRWVCDLCKVRAESAGWIAAGLAATARPQATRASHGRGRMRRLLERAREIAAPAGDDSSSGAEAGASADAAAPPAGTEQPRRVRRRRAEGSEREARRPSSRRETDRGEERADAARRPRRRSVPRSPAHRIRRALETFNASPHRRTVGGLNRSLGAPQASAVTSPEAPSEVRITVAWELSWYQWRVDLAADGPPIAELAKGDDVSELEEPDRVWNVTATSEGELRLATAEAAADA